MTAEGSRRRHVLMLLSNGYTDDARVRNETRTLVGAGYDVTVVAWDRRGDGAPEETLDGARVVRLRNTRWMRTVPFDLARLRPWWRQATRAGLDVAARASVDAVCAHDLDTLPAGVRLKRRLGVPLVYDAHEIWGNMIARDIALVVPAWAHRLERRLLKHVDHLITVNQALATHFRALLPEPTPLSIVQNAKPLLWDRWEAPPAGPFTVLYIGRLNPARFIVESMEALADIPDIRFIVAGIGKPDYVQRVQAAADAAANVSFIGRVPNDTVLQRTRDAHLVLHLVDPSDPNNRIGTGNKQFESLAAGRPIVCAERTNDGRVANEIGHGVTIPFTKEAVRRVVSELAADPARVEQMGRTALDAARREYNWDTQAARLLSAYAGLLGSA